MALTAKLPRSVDYLAAMQQSDYIDAKTLAASTAETFTPPSGATHVVFSANGDFYVKFNSTATIPGDTSGGTAAELNPTVRRLLLGQSTAVTSISVIAPAATQVTAMYFLAP